MKGPEFFIVGAPKCGTTAMQEYLRQHPDIFMPDMKEIHHFADDLLKHDDPFLDGDRYLSLFAGAHEHQLIGEASVYHLFSRNAARNIKSFCPNAKIIIILRNPVDMLYSRHAQLVYNGAEDILDFEASLAAEEKRRNGELIPKNIRIEKKLLHREVVKFAAQVKRYFDMFGRDKVQVIIYDDLRKDTAKVYQETLGFLNVNDSFRPDFKVINPNKRVRTRTLQHLLKTPPSLMRIAGKLLLPQSCRNLLLNGLKKLNTQFVPRQPMSPELRRRLQKEFTPEIKNLSELLGRDLTHWCTD
ncbi:MAG: sulfotransferase [Candidatus Brocadia sp.]|nr:sulfotransferase domain-containing protein [Candidatus Brocadia sp.]MDG6026545.1 sulfotransferase [Candidatus Brocadia sp.]